MVHSYRIVVSQQMMSLLGFFFMLIYFFDTNDMEHMRVAARMVSCCKHGGFLRCMKIYIYLSLSQHLMGNGINFINQQHIPKSAFMSVN